MKTLILLALLAIGSLGVLTGCEHEHEEHHHGGAYGAPAPGYDYGRGGYYNPNYPNYDVH
jgi:hypothetical protein